MQSGASDYLMKPISKAQVQHAVDKAFKSAHCKRISAETRRTPGRRRHLTFKSSNSIMTTLLTRAEQAAATDATVLLLGETGTGKSILARHIHECSGRAQHPFVTVACAEISSTLIETELFGQASGAFSHASPAHAGFVETAAGGTLFLDEIGDLIPALQGKLLRLLEEREFVRVGDSEPRRCEARVIAATHRDLKQAVKGGRFRADLYYRLNVLNLRVPALRERPEDIWSWRATSCTSWPCATAVSRWS